MKGKILVTDSLFIFDEHVKQLEAAGYEVERLDKPEATEDELCEAIKGKVGYILGGVEHPTDKVINSADQLKAIVFTGIDYKGFIPGWKLAESKGIKLGHTPDSPTQTVAEWAISAALMMNRGFLELSREGDKKFLTTEGIEGLSIGVVGLGRIGSRITEMIKVFRPAEVNYFSLHKHPEEEKKLGIGYLPLEDLLAKSDIVFLGIPKGVGRDFIDTEKLKHIKKNALIVSFSYQGIVNENALYEAIKNRRARAISDYPAKDERFNGLPINHWFSFNGSNAFNTYAELKLTSDTATKILLEMLGE